MKSTRERTCALSMRRLGFTRPACSTSSLPKRGHQLRPQMLVDAQGVLDRIDHRILVRQLQHETHHAAVEVEIGEHHVRVRPAGHRRADVQGDGRRPGARFGRQKREDVRGGFDGRAACAPPGSLRCPTLRESPGARTAPTENRGRRARMISRSSFESIWRSTAMIWIPSASVSSSFIASCALSSDSKLRKTTSGVCARSDRTRSMAFGYRFSDRPTVTSPVASRASCRRLATSWSGQTIILLSTWMVLLY